MNWVCDSCGYENEYNDESQPTECLCCGEPASEDLLNQARRALEEHHKEQEHQKRLEQLRLNAIRRQETIERSIKNFIKGVKTLATVCIVFMILSVAFAGFNIYKGNISLKYIMANTKSITVMDNMVSSAKIVSSNLSHNVSEFEDNIIQNTSYIPNGRKYIKIENLKMLTDINKENENRNENIVLSETNISDFYNNFTVNINLCWMQATKNFNHLINTIYRKVGRSK